MSFNRKSHAHAPNATYVRKDAAQWKKRGWTPTPNSLVRDPDLPPAVCWAWTWLASHTDEFEVSGLVLWKANNHLGRNRAYELLSELERRGLLLRRHEVDEHGVPYQIYDLQPVPVPEDERTWTPSKAVGKRGPHPQREARMQGQKQALTEVPNGPVLGAESGQSEVIHNPQVTPGFPVGRETVATCGNVDAEGGGSFPVGREWVSPGGAGTGGAGESYKEEKITRKEHPSLPSPPTPPASTATANEGGREGVRSAKKDDQPEPEPSQDALASIAGLEFGAHRRPTLRQAQDLARQVDAAVAGGLALVEVRRHAQASVNAARPPKEHGNAVSYLAGALTPDNLPHMLAIPAARAVAAREVAQPPADDGQPTMDRAAALADIMATLSRKRALCASDQ